MGVLSKISRNKLNEIKKYEDFIDKIDWSLFIFSATLTLFPFIIKIIKWGLKTGHISQFWQPYIPFILTALVLVMFWLSTSLVLRAVEKKFKENWIILLLVVVGLLIWGWFSWKDLVNELKGEMILTSLENGIECSFNQNLNPNNKFIIKPNEKGTGLDYFVIIGGKEEKLSCLPQQQAN